jgi:hypothetical protein
MSIGSTQPFRASGTTQVSAGTASAKVALSGGGEAVLIYNAAAAVAFVRFGTNSSLQASPTDTPVPPGSRMLMHVGGPFVTTAAAILASGSGTVFFTRGDGTVY